MSARRRDGVVDTLRRRIITGLESGTLQPDERLPSTREISRQLETDPRVVLAAYKELAREGLVDLRQRSGVFVRARPAAEGGALRTPSAAWLAAVLAQGVARELAAPEIGDWLTRAVSTRSLRAVALATTSDQVYGMCRELRDDYGLTASGVEIDRVAGLLPAPKRKLPVAVQRAELLVTTQAHGALVGKLAAMLDVPVVVANVRGDIVSSEWRVMLQQQPIYVIAADARFVELLLVYLRREIGAALASRIIPLVVGRDSVSDVPREARTYVTRAARTKLGVRNVPGRPLPNARVFHVESARAILEIVVRINLEALA